MSDRRMSTEKKLVVLLVALNISCEAMIAIPIPGSVEGTVEYCWNASCSPWEWGGEVTLTGIGPPTTSTFVLGTFALTSVHPGRYSLLVDSSTTLRFGAGLLCLPKFSPEQIEVFEARPTQVTIQAQLACR